MVGILYAYIIWKGLHKATWEGEVTVRSHIFEESTLYSLVVLYNVWQDKSAVLKAELYILMIYSVTCRMCSFDYVLSCSVMQID